MFDHLIIRVNDLDGMAAYYERVMGPSATTRASSTPAACSS